MGDSFLWPRSPTQPSPPPQSPEHVIDIEYFIDPYDTTFMDPNADNQDDRWSVSSAGSIISASNSIFASHGLIGRETAERQRQEQLKQRIKIAGAFALALSQCVIVMLLLRGNPS